MKVKLTLNIDKEVIEKTKRFLKDRNQSISEVVEGYLRSLILDEKKQPRISKRLRSLRGCIKLPPGKDYKEILIEELSKKYL